MEVVHRRVEEEEEEVVVVEQLRPRRRATDLADPRDDDVSESSDDTINGGYEVHQNSISDEKSVYFDKEQGIWKCHHCIWTHKIGQPWILHLHQNQFSQGDHTKLKWSENNHEGISKLVNDVINHQNLGDFKDEIISISTTTENARIDDEESDEEVIELEFESAVEKVHTHTPYCPNCSNRITKVILRRKKRTRPLQEKPLDLLGCFRCFSIFIPLGDSLNPFGFFRSKGPKVESPQVEGDQSSTDVGGTNTNAAGSKLELESPKVEPSTDVGSTNTNAGGHRLNPLNFFGSKPKLESPKIEDEQPLGSTTTNAAVISGYTKPRHPPHVTVEINETGPETISGGRLVEQPLISGIQHSKSFEILKCIVYGGLIESITSLSIVSSAAASNATTSNVVVIGLATLFSGLIAFGCNLVELRNDNSNEKYQEVLGRRGHFLLHSTFAILSYLVFGLVAPTTYALAFGDSDNKDYKILAVAAAALASIFILAVAKAYVKGTDKFGGYYKAILYYVTLAVSASGVAYAAGDLFGMLFHNLALFPSSPPLLSGMLSPTTPASSSY